MSCPYDKTHENSCPVLGFQDVMVGVPVEIKPFAHVGKIETECIGKPIIKRESTNIEFKPEQVCKFSVFQKIRVEIPMIFGAKTKVGEAIADCKGCNVEKKLDRKQLTSSQTLNEYVIDYDNDKNTIL